jgi:putative phosphoribosyl transferase
MDDNELQIVNEPITVKREGLALDGLLGIPPTAVGVVVFAHGGGSGQFGPRNKFVARQLQQGGWPPSLSIY